MDTRIGQLNRDGRTVYYLNGVNGTVEGTVEELETILKAKDTLGLSAPVADPLTRNFVINAVRNRYNDGYNSVGKSEGEDLYIIIPQLRNEFWAIAHADKGREVFQGPVKENIVFLFARCSWIDNHGGMNAAIKRAGSITVTLGDTLTFIGRTFRVEDCGDHYNAKLIEITASEAK